MRSIVAQRFLEFVTDSVAIFDFDVVGSDDRGEHDSVTLRIRPDIPTEPVADIRPTEEIQIEFTEDDSRLPRVLIKRTDFPALTHVNPQSSPGERKSICLYEESWSEIRLNWNSHEFLARIFEWFSRAANGVLHLEEQAVEPLFIEPFVEWILPSSILDGLSRKISTIKLNVATTELADNRLLLRNAPLKQTSGTILARVSAIEADPIVHGQLQIIPTNLADLLAILGPAKEQFYAEIVKQLAQRPAHDEEKFMLLVRFPIRRTESGPVEKNVLLMFAFADNYLQVGKALGVLADAHEHGAGFIMQTEGPDLQVCAKAPILPIKVSMELTPELAAEYSGIDVNDARFVMIGAGALGSQVMDNVGRMAWGRWTIVDSDHVRPHNIIRHVAYKSEVGRLKTESVTARMNDLTDSLIAESIDCDVLNPKEHSKALTSAFESATMVVDLSASTAVSRHLANSQEMPRCISGFIGPGLNSLILIAEDVDRQHRLDWLEMTLFRDALSNPEIANCLEDRSTRIPYANSCRDKSVVLPQDVVAILAGIGSKSLRAIEKSTKASILCFKLNPDSSVTRSDVETFVPQKQAINGWTVVWDDHVIQGMKGWRSMYSPRETGGVLIGSRDNQRKIIYVVCAVGPPVDSTSAPNYFERGTRQLGDFLKSVHTITAGGLYYVGEWHSHPPGRSATPSDTDKIAMTTLKKSAQSLDHPVLMGIIGHNQSVSFTVE